MTKPKKAKNTSPVRVELACGQNKEDGWIGVDIADTEQADIVHDLMQFPWPFEDDSVDHIRCSHFIEHIPMDVTPEGKDLFFAFFDEVWRILKPSPTGVTSSAGKIELVAPYYTSMRAWQDPTHRRAITDGTFLYFDKTWREANGLDHYNVMCDFEFHIGYAISDPRWQTASDEARNRAILNYNNVVDDITATMFKRQ